MTGKKLKYRRHLELTILGEAIMGITLLVGGIFLVMFYHNLPIANLQLRAGIIGGCFGGAAGALGGIIYRLRALFSEKNFQKLYLKEKDEMNVDIKQKSGFITFLVMTYLCVVIMFIAAYLNNFTLFWAMTEVVLVSYIVFYVVCAILKFINNRQNKDEE
jgi:hypothetical protein